MKFDLPGAMPSERSDARMLTLRERMPPLISIAIDRTVLGTPYSVLTAPTRSIPPIS